MLVVRLSCSVLLCVRRVSWKVGLEIEVEVVWAVSSFVADSTALVRDRRVEGNRRSRSSAGRTCGSAVDGGGEERIGACCEDSHSVCDS